MPTPSTRARKRATPEATTTAVGARAVRRRAGTPDPAAMDAPASALQVEVDMVTASDGATEQAEELADDEGPAPAVGAVFTTTSLSTMAFAVAGTVRLISVNPTAVTEALLLMLNENREQGLPALTQLPGLVELFGILGVPIALTDKGGSTTYFPPPGLVDESLRRALSHNGRGARIGSTLLTVDDPSWTTISTRDAKAGAHIHLGTMGLRRFGSWKLPLIPDVDRQLGAPAVSVGKRARSPETSANLNPNPNPVVPAATERLNGGHGILPSPSTTANVTNAAPPIPKTSALPPRDCDGYVQGASNADSCVWCGRAAADHRATEAELLTRIQNLESKLAQQREGVAKQVSLSPQISREGLKRVFDHSVATSPEFSVSSFSANTVFAQPAQKLLMWSKFGYEEWKKVREAAKLASATGSRDHQKFHVADEMNQVLSAICDKYAGVTTKERYGQALTALNAKPLDDWIKHVDSMMRLEFNVPIFDTIDLTLKADSDGRPLLDEFKTAVILFSNQEKFHKDEEKLLMLRTAIEVNFLSLSVEILEPMYMRWRRDKPDLLQALFEVCDLLQPFTIQGINFGKAKRAGYKKFFCLYCKGNDDHSTKDCTKKGSGKLCTTCKSTDHNTADCPKPKKPVCPICKKTGHTQDKCWSGKGGAKDVKTADKADAESSKNGAVPNGKTKDQKKPPDTYVCRACGIPGHWKDNCPGKP